MGHRVGNARKKKAYKAHFNPDWVKEWPALIAKSHKGDTDAFCSLCRCDFSVSSGEFKTYSVNSLIVTRCHLSLSVSHSPRRAVDILLQCFWFSVHICHSLSSAIRLAAGSPPLVHRPTLPPLRVILGTLIGL